MAALVVRSLGFTAHAECKAAMQLAVADLRHAYAAGQIRTSMDQLHLSCVCGNCADLCCSMPQKSYVNLQKKKEKATRVILCNCV